MPAWLTAATGMDTFIHALEAFVGRRANPYTDQLALAALRNVWEFLPRATADGDDMEAREQMMLATLWAGSAMDHAGLGLVHSLSGPLTGALHLHHGLTNALLLPHVMRFNLPAIPAERRDSLNHIFGLATDASDDVVVERLFDFVRKLGLPTRLAELGKPLDTVDWNAIAEETTRMVLLTNNPRPASVEECGVLLAQMQ
jgi:alcohol dehydrogenase